MTWFKNSIGCKDNSCSFEYKVCPKGFIILLNEVPNSVEYLHLANSSVSIPKFKLSCVECASFILKPFSVSVMEYSSVKRPIDGEILGDKPSSIADAVHSTKGVFSFTIVHAAPNDLHLYSVQGLFGSSVHLSHCDSVGACHVEQVAVHVVVSCSPLILMVKATIT